MKKTAKKKAPPKKAVPKKRSTEQYYTEVQDALRALKGVLPEHVDTDQIEAELKKTKPRSPTKFANDFFWAQVMEHQPGSSKEFKAKNRPRPVNEDDEPIFSDPRDDFRFEEDEEDDL